jgi:SPP1 family predicted phage head-tail adaptor
MPSGELRERLTFSRRAVTSDGYGNTEGDWEEQFTVWGRVRPRLGGEEVMAARLSGRSVATITLRYSEQTALIDSDWRAVNANSGEVWNIRSAINPDERRRYIELLAEKGVGV